MGIIIGIDTIPTWHLQPGTGDGEHQPAHEMRLDKPLSLEERQLIVQRALGSSENHDAEDYLQRLRARFDRLELLIDCSDGVTGRPDFVLAF